MRKHEGNNPEGVEAVKNSVADLCRSMQHLNLTQTERKILAVKLLPQCLEWTIREMAAAIEVPERTWRQAVLRERFKDEAVKFVKQFFVSEIPDIARAYLRLAKSGDRQACERLLVEGRAIAPPVKGDVNVAVAVTVEESDDKLKEGLNRFGYAISDN